MTPLSFTLWLLKLRDQQFTGKIQITVDVLHGTPKIVQVQPWKAA